MQDPVIFADAFNQFVYHGKQVIKAEELTEMDTNQIVIPYGKDGAIVPEQKYRDVLKVMKTDGKKAYCIMGIENQTEIHYAMPVRNMLYDAILLANQVMEAARSYRKEEKSETEQEKYDEAIDTLETKERPIEATMKETEEKQKEKVSRGEFLSGFHKGDKLLPVITLVIYWGAEEWDAPLALSEMYA